MLKPATLRVFRGRSDSLVFVSPRCAVLPHEALLTHGPLHPCGNLELPRAGAGSTWGEIIDQVDRHAYATLGFREAELLLGPGHPCLAIW
ncbi:MAG: hypothetical protein EPO46_09110 [Lysobacter sp.]|nr:MAG: hypothetical protein EPO46_09110 [Lysobacter sp.]